MAAAANSKGRVIAGSFVARILAGKATAFPRRGVHASAYDKNLDEHVRPAVVPDDVITSAGNSEKYWGPHPKTGVFGPAVEAKGAASAPEAGANGGDTVLDKKVWFRPLEDIDKPPVA